MRWFERKFEMGFPVELVPGVLARLRGTPVRLEELLLKVGREGLVEKPEGKWSALENAGHLLDLEPLWLARVEDFVAGKAELTPTDLQNRKTDEASYNQRTRYEVLPEFRAARAKLLRRVEAVEAEAWEREIVHPRLKTPMRLADHLYFVAEHDDHHLARIWELVGKKQRAGEATGDVTAGG